MRANHYRPKDLDLLPLGLSEYSCNGVMWDDGMPWKFIARLKRLTIREDFEGKALTSSSKPILCCKRFNMLTGTCSEPLELLHAGQSDAKTKQDLRTLWERSVAGCKLGCAVVTLTGSIEEVGEALACLPSLPAVSTLRGHYIHMALAYSSSHMSFLRTLTLWERHAFRQASIL